MSVWSWFGGIFHTIKVKIAPIIVAILEVIKGGEESGIMDQIAKLIDSALKTHVAEDINALIKKNIYNAIAAFLGIEGLPDNPTDDQLKAFISAATTALLGKAAADSIKGKTYQDFGVKLFDIIRKEIDAAKISGKAITANQIAMDLEEAYQDYLAAQAAAAQQASDTQS